MKLLFITRTYPPLIGGMEKFASDFYENYHRYGDIDLLANSGGKKTIILFFFKVVFFLILRSRNYDVIHIYDAVLSPLLLVVKAFSNAKVSFTVNGLDVVFSGFGYQKFMPFFLSKADKIFAISHYTMEQCTRRGISKEKLMVVPVGLDFVDIESFSEEKKSEIMSRIKVPIKGKRILITVGRLVARKGHAWFIEHVMKKLPEHYIYLIAGDGPEHDSLIDLLQQLDLENRVYLLGRVSDETKNCLYQVADFFVMPNIRVENDQEGFGIVLLEAGYYGLPVVASNIEGIRDAVINGKTGLLIEERDVQGFIDAIINTSINSSSVKDTIEVNFDWNHIAEKYYKEFQRICIESR